MRTTFMRLSCLAVLISVGVGYIRWNVTRPEHEFSELGCPNRQFPAADPQPEIVQASHDTLDVATNVPKVLIHVWMIEFMVTSPDALAIGKDFETRLESALVEFNSQSFPQSGDFATSDTLAALIKDFKSRGKVTIYDESPRPIESGQTDNWGDFISIAATPNIESSDSVRLSLLAAIGYGDPVNNPYPLKNAPYGMRNQTTLTFRSGRTLNVGGGGYSGTETKPVFPLLGQIPTIGHWLAIPITRTRSCKRQFLVSATILPSP